MDICLGYVTDFWANIPPIFALIIFVTNFWHLLPMLGFTGSLRIEAAEETDQVLVILPVIFISVVLFIVFIVRFIVIMID